MGMVAWARHPEMPEILLQDKVSELASQLPPMLPQTAPIFLVDVRGPVDSLVLQKPGHAEQKTFCGGSVIMKDVQFQSLRQDQERDLVQLVAERDSKGLEEGFIHAVRDGGPSKLIGLSSHSNPGGRFDQRIDRLAWEQSQWRATAAWMGNRRMDVQEVDFALQVNLNDFLIQAGPGKISGSPLPEKQMKDDTIKVWVLRVAVPIPIGDVDIQFDVSLEQFVSINPQRGVNEIGTGFAIPEAKLDNLDQRTGNGTESSPKRSRVPHRLPFEFGPFFVEMVSRFS